MDPWKVDIVLGPPGTGKTTKLLSVMEQAIATGISPNKVGFISFTKKAAEEGKARAAAKFNMSPDDLTHFRTLHSFAFRYFSMKRDQVFGWPHIRELGKKLGIEFKGRGQVSDDDVYGMNSADRMLFLEGLARNTKQPLKEVWSSAFEDDIDWWELERFTSAMASYKKNRQLWDFTDMLERFCLVDPRTLPKFELLIVDEAQDLSPLQWDAIELLAQNSRSVYVAGDDDQCHPTGTPILTSNRGPVPIECLNPQQDRLIYWRRKSHCFHGFNKTPASFEIAKREFSGKLVCVTVDGTTIKFTPEHKLIVRFMERSQNWRAVYLMRRGNDFRVGQCQLFNSDKAFHAAIRMRCEKADSMWILRISQDPLEILKYECEISMRYGLPQICFNVPTSNQATLQNVSDHIFQTFDTAVAAKKCLLDHNLLINSPFWNNKRAAEKSGGTSICSMEAANLLPELMAVPKMIHSHKEDCAWTRFSIDREDYTGEVHSLNVHEWHTYVAGNFAVHNCIYKWAGADVEHFISLPGRVQPLETSYRVPRSVHTLADQIVSRLSKRRPKLWSPRGEVGSVNWYNDIEEVDLSKDTWLLLARNGYMLDELENWCLSQGFSFHSVNKDPLKSDSLVAIRVWENLRNGKDESAERVLEMFKYADPRMVPASLMKQLKADEASRMYAMPQLKNLGLKSNAIWHEFLTKISPKERDFFIAARKRNEALWKEPRITISTIHASKGGQADHVLLLTDMSYRCFANMQAQYDDEVRVWYVAATRCRQSLNLIMPKTNLNFEL